MIPNIDIPVKQDIIVDVIDSNLEVAYANQYDDNTSTIHCHIQNKGVDFNVESYTATLRVKKSNEKGFSATIGSKELQGSINGNVVSFKIPRYLTVSHGKQVCNLEFFDEDNVENGIKYSCTFYLRVYESALKDEDILDSDYYASVHDEYVKLKTDMTDALTQEQERATQAENTISDNLAAHSDDKENPHNVTKMQLGLGSVEDKSSAAIREEITKVNVTDALGYTPYTPNEVDNKLSELETNKVDKIDGKGLSTNDFTNDYKTTLDNISGGTVTGIKGNAESTYRTGNVNITKDNIGLGNVDNTADANKNVESANYLKIIHGNEINFKDVFLTPSNTRVWFNYRDADTDAASTKKINEYKFGNSRGSTEGVTLFADNFSGNAASATKASKVIDSYNGNDVTFAYGKNGLNYGDYTYLAGWNGYELRGVNKSQFLATTGGFLNGTVHFGDDELFDIGTADGFQRTLHIMSYYYGTSGVELYKYVGSLNVRPINDNDTSLGANTNRWKQIYAVNSSISTSDKNEKHDISYIGESTDCDTYMSDEQLEQMIMGLKPCVFKRNNGESGRPHHGIIAQDFENLLEDIGLSDHAGFIKSPKTEQIEIDTGKLDENGNPIKEIEEQVIEGEYIYGFRYEELISDIIRFAQLQKLRADSLEDEIAKIKDELSSVKSKIGI